MRSFFVKLADCKCQTNILQLSLHVFVTYLHIHKFPAKYPADDTGGGSCLGAYRVSFDG